MAAGLACRAIPHFLFSKKLSGLVGKLQAKRQSKSSKTQGESKNSSKSSKNNEGGEKNETSKPSTKNQGKTKKIAAAVRNTCGAASNFVKMMDLRKKILTLRDLLDLSPCLGSASDLYICRRPR